MGANPKKLFVGGLPYATTEDELRSIFEEYGEVESAVVITDRMTGRSKGFGFVEMATEEGAQSAISALNGDSEKTGRRLTVNEARPQAPRAPRY